MDWDPNDSSPACVLCGTRWGRVFNRRHHCRHCGRLVCEACSSRRLKLPKSDQPDVPQRVCDACHKMLRRREEYQKQTVRRRDKGLELLFATSFQSPCLVDVFFLDGSYVTASIDEMSTTRELAATLLHNADIALFFVKQDVFNPQHYTLLTQDTTVAQLMTASLATDMPYAKIVAPMYSSRNRSSSVSLAAAVADPQQRVVKAVLPRGVDKLKFEEALRIRTASGASDAPRGSGAAGSRDEDADSRGEATAAAAAAAAAAVRPKRHHPQQHPLWR